MPHLTDRQRQCLEGFLARKTAKHIGRDLGITHHAVEQHLKAARRKLGAADTMEAARIYAGHSDTTAAPYYAVPELSASAVDEQCKRQPEQVDSKLRDIATDDTVRVQSLSARQTLIAIGLCGIGAITILSLILAVANGVAQLVP